MGSLVWRGAVLDILSRDSNGGRPWGVVQVDFRDEDCGWIRRRSLWVTRPCFCRYSVIWTKISWVCLGERLPKTSCDDWGKISPVKGKGTSGHDGWDELTRVTFCSIIVGRRVSEETDESGELGVGSEEELSSGRLVGCRWGLVLGESVGCWLARNLVFSLTEATLPINLLSKSTGVEVQDMVPGIIQSDESSTGRINFGKVRKLPELLAKKLHPCRRRRQRTKRRRLRSKRTWSTSWSMTCLPPNISCIAPLPRHDTLLLSAKITWSFYKFCRW